MPIEVSWSGFNGRKFQEFCNALLLFTVGKKAKVYSKSGPDGGTDQLFEGTFEGSVGKWRFQDKFHAGSDSEEKYLQRAIIDDIENLVDENGIIYITNINLLPQQEERVLKAAKAEIARKTSRKIVVEIWHHAKIEAKLKEAPLAYYWYWQPSHIALQKYAYTFAYELDKNNLNLPNQFHKPFIGRESDLGQLSSFLFDPNFVAIGVTGEGGAGKTRLVIEFFKKYINDSSEYEALVLTDNYNANTNLTQLLSSSNLKYVILVDDAQNKADALSWINRFALNNKGRVKIIFTTRDSLYSQTISKIPRQEQNFPENKIELTPLSKQETYEIVKSILPGVYPEEDIARLTMVSKGNPAIILGLCQLVVQGRGLRQIIKEDSFNESVKQIVNEIAEDISSSRGIFRERIIKAIHSIAVLGPVGDTEKNRNLLSSITNTETTDFDAIIEELRTKHFLNSYGKIAIRIDPYSESIFSSVATSNQQIKNWSAQKLNNEMRSNFLRNLVIANKITGNNHSIQEDGLLYKFIEQIKDYDFDYTALYGIVDSIRQISLLKPDVAAYCVKIFTEIYQDANHPLLNHDKNSWYTPKIEHLAKDIDQMAKNVLIATNGDNKVEERTKIIIDYAKSSKRHEIINACFRFTMQDLEFYRFGYAQGFVRQKFIAAQLKDWVTGKDEILRLQGMKIIRYFLAMDHHEEGFYNPVTSSISVINWQITEMPIFHEIRTLAIESLIKLAKLRSANRDLKKEAIREICQAMFFIVKDRYSKYDMTNEIKTAINFIEENLDTEAGDDIKIELFDFLQLFKRKEIKNEYKEVYSRLLEKVTKVKTSKEKILQLVHQRYASLNENSFVSDCDKWLKSYAKPKEIIDDLLEVRPSVEQGWQMNFNYLVDITAQKFTAESKIWFDSIVKSHPEFIADFISLLTVNFQEEDYFYSQIDRLWKMENGKYWPTLIWALTSGRKRAKENYRNRDLDYFEEAITQKQVQAIYTLNFDLPSYAWINKEKAFSLMAKVMDDFPRLRHGNILSWIFHSPNTFTEEFKEEVKELILHHTNMERLGDHDMQLALSFLENKFGFDTLFGYVKSRLKHFSEYTGEHFSFLTLGDRYYNQKNSIDKSIDNFLKVLEWYIKDRHSKKYLSEYVLHFFLPRTAFDEKLSNKIKSFVQANKSKESIAKTAEAFIEVNHKTIEFIDLIVWLAAQYIELDSNADVKLLFNLFFRHILYGDGVKSGRPGFPFPVDIAKKELLAKFINERRVELDPRILALLRECLNQVEKNIEEDIKRSNDFDI